MARTVRNTASYIKHPGDSSRKGAQRQVNKKTRRGARVAIRIGSDVMPLVRHEVDRIMH